MQRLAGARLRIGEHQRLSVVAAFAQPYVDRHLTQQRHPRAGRLGERIGYRLATAGAIAATQIHTHLCYSEFNVVLGAIDALDADVTSIESARSRGEILEALEPGAFLRGIGPGVWDIHSPRVPTFEEVAQRVRHAAHAIGAERVWVNPDCGLKTRAWPETEAALDRLVAAAVTVRAELARDDDAARPRDTRPALAAER